MPIKLSSFKNKTRTVTVKFGDDECQVTYRVNAITPAYIDSFKEMKTMSEVWIKQICDLVTHWQMLDEDGKEILPTPEFVTTLSTDFLGEVVKAIRGDINLSPDQKNA